MFSFLWPLLLSNTSSLKLAFIQLTFSLHPCEQTTDNLDCIVANSSLVLEVESWSLFLWNTWVSYSTNLPPRYKYLLHPYQKMCLPCKVSKNPATIFVEKTILTKTLPSLGSALSQVFRDYFSSSLLTFLDQAEAGVAASGTEGGPGRGSGFGRI